MSHLFPPQTAAVTHRTRCMRAPWFMMNALQWLFQSDSLCMVHGIAPCRASFFFTLLQSLLLLGACMHYNPHQMPCCARSLSPLHPWFVGSLSPPLPPTPSPKPLIHTTSHRMTLIVRTTSKIRTNYERRGLRERGTTRKGDYFELDVTCMVIQFSHTELGDVRKGDNFKLDVTCMVAQFFQTELDNGILGLPNVTLSLASLECKLY